VTDASRSSRALETPPEGVSADEAPAAAPPGSPPVASARAWLALHRSAERAALAVEASPDGGWPAAELRDHLALLCRAVRAVADGKPAPSGVVASGAPLHRLLDALRREFLVAMDEEVRTPHRRCGCCRRSSA
jgi:hypothetical protein